VVQKGIHIKGATYHCSSLLGTTLWYPQGN